MGSLRWYLGLLPLTGKGLISLWQGGIGITWRKTRRVLARVKSYDKWARKPLFEPRELAIQRRKRFPVPLTFSIVVPLYNTPERFLREMLESVQAQTYREWQLCLADGSDDEVDRSRIVGEYAAHDARIAYKRLAYNGGIAENTNAALAMAEGEYVALLDHDDILHPAALYEVRRVIAGQGADFIYTDEAVFASPRLKSVFSIHFKPDFAPDNLLANNYICHFTAFSRKLLHEAGNFRSAYDGSQDHELFLRLTAKAKRIVHLPEVLYYWRAHPLSNAMGNVKNYAGPAGVRAVRDFLAASGQEAEVEVLPQCPTMYRVRYKLREKPLVSILVLSHGRAAATLRCVQSLVSKTAYDNWEILVLARGEDLERLSECEKAGSVKVLVWEGISEATACNFVAGRAKGEYLLFLHGDTEVINREWLEEMLMHAQRAQVGAVGAMLYYPNNIIQHAGALILRERIAVRHAFAGVKRGELGYMGRLCYAQNLSAVSGACLLVKRSLWKEMGGMLP